MRFYTIILILTFFISSTSLSFAQVEKDAQINPNAVEDKNEKTKEEIEAQAEKDAVEKQTEEDTYRQLNLFGDVFERVRGQYVEPVTDETLIENAVQGMLANLDPHSSYLDEDDFADMQVQTRGEFGGLGIEVSMENGFVKVVSPIDDTPAFNAGIEAGDYITHLDEQPVMGLSLSEAVDKMRGKVGEPILITVVREGAEEAMDIKIIRDVIKIQSVRSRVEQNDVGYIRVTVFNQNTMPGVKEAIENIKKETNGNLVGYIIDMRNNPGGLLDQAIEVSDAFLDKGEIVSTRGRTKKDTKRDNATPGDLAEGKPIIVLVNGGSASASEIVAGALQDHRRALVVGTTTFGKGSVQTIIPLPGHGAMRLTTARYYTPSGRSIQAEGIEPDIIIEQATLTEDEVRQMTKESDLRGALNNDSKVDNKKSDEDEKEADKKKDYQLDRAIDLLRGIIIYGDKITNSEA